MSGTRSLPLLIHLTSKMDSYSFDYAKNLATCADLELMRPSIQKCLETSFSTGINEGRVLSGKYLYINGWKSVNLSSIIKPAVFDVMSIVFFGEIWHEPEFRSALIRYPQDAELSAVAHQYMPGFIAPVIESICTRNSHAKQILTQRLMLAMKQPKEGKAPRALDAMITSIKKKEPWTPLGIAETVLVAWIEASAQALLMSIYVVFQACTSIPELESLPKEIGGSNTLIYTRLNSLPVLDRFVEEAARNLMLGTQNHDKIDFGLYWDSHLKDSPMSNRSNISLTVKLVLADFFRKFNPRIAEETAVELKGNEKMSPYKLRVTIRADRGVEEEW